MDWLLAVFETEEPAAASLSRADGHRTAGFVRVCGAPSVAGRDVFAVSMRAAFGDCALGSAARRARAAATLAHHCRGTRWRAHYAATEVKWPRVDRRCCCSSLRVLLCAERRSGAHFGPYEFERGHGRVVLAAGRHRGRNPGGA